eukprot:5981922-Amphidinium_carterae.1
MGDNLPNVDLNGETVLQLTCGIHHTCVIVTGGTVKCWGTYEENHQDIGAEHIGDGPGEMGANLPSVALGSGRSASQLHATQKTTCALLDDASIKCWGVPYGGHLLGSEDRVTRGQSPGTMGDNLPAVDLGSAFTPAPNLTGGLYHRCVISTTGTVKCWGDNSGWVLGYEDSEARGDDPGEMGDKLPVVNFGDGLQVVEGAGGYLHMCYIFTTQQVKCLGSSTFTLGYGDNTARTTNLADNLPFLDFGSRDGVPLIATSIDAGTVHTCVVLDSNEIKCWGDGSEGKLGQGDQSSRLSPGDTLPAVWLGADFGATSTTSTSTSSTAFSVTSSTSSSTSTSTSSSMTS